MGSMSMYQARVRSFVLLEVMVALVFMAVALVALLRGFTVSLDSLKKIRLNEEAIVLAKSILQDMELEPPALENETYEGEFADDPRFGEDYEDWRWEMEVELEDVDYDVDPEGNVRRDLEPILIADLRIFYQSDVMKDEYLPIQVTTILPTPDVFSIRSIQENQLF